MTSSGASRPVQRVNESAPCRARTSRPSTATPPAARAAATSGVGAGVRPVGEVDDRHVRPQRAGVERQRVGRRRPAERRRVDDDRAAAARAARRAIARRARAPAPPPPPAGARPRSPPRPTPRAPRPPRGPRRRRPARGRAPAPTPAASSAPVIAAPSVESPSSRPSSCTTIVFTLPAARATSVSSSTRAATPSLCGIVTLAPANDSATRPASAASSRPASTRSGTYAQSRPERPERGVLHARRERVRHRVGDQADQARRRRDHCTGASAVSPAAAPSCEVPAVAAPVPSGGLSRWNCRNSS